jgi:hypothetical protein
MQKVGGGGGAGRHSPLSKQAGIYDRLNKHVSP